MTNPTKNPDFDSIDVDIAALQSGSAASGDVPEADGAGGVAWSPSGGSFDGVTNNLSVTDWQITDVGNNGFPGDQTGSDLAQFIADNTSAGSKDLFILPEGTYNWNRSLQFTGDAGGEFDEDRPDTIGIVGKPEATIHVDIGATEHFSDRICFIFGNSTTGVEQVTLQNLHFDVGNANSDRDAGIMRCHIEDRGHFEDISLSARRRWEAGATGADSEKNGDRFCMKLDCANRDAEAYVKDVRFPNGDVYESGAESAGHAIPFSAENEHRGTTYWINCYAEGFIDNGFYLRDGRGTNYVLGCTSKNNGAGGFRLGLNDHAQDITMVADGAQDINATPLWIEHNRDSVSDQTNYVEGDEDSPPVTVDNFEIYATGDPVNDLIRITQNPGQVSISDGYIRCTTDDYVFDGSAHTGTVGIKDVMIDDEATGQVRRAAINVAMDNVTFDDITYRPDPPDTENGRSIFAVEGSRITIEKSDLEGTYVPAIEVYSGADYRVENNHFEHDGSFTDPYLIRNNETGVDALWLAKNDITAYATIFDTNSANTDYSHYYSAGQRGP